MHVKVAVRLCLYLVYFFLGIGQAAAQQADSLLIQQSNVLKLKMAAEDPWYETIQLRGYTQLRYNRLLETNPDLTCIQCDRSWGKNGGFFFRRIRLIFYGNLHERVFFYIQPDFGSSPTGADNNFTQIRDAYFDLALDAKRTFRLRLGQSKVPFGFENLQSSQNRLPLDRNDALNSAVANERDIGVFFYWAPEHIRKRFSHLVRSGLKGSGDYGVVGLGVYNGQTASRPELNNTQHVVARLTYPFEWANGQLIEPFVSAYTGKFVVSKRSGVLGATEFTDQRMTAGFVKYPQPWGIQAEYNTGIGPEFNPENQTIESRRLRGGYAQLMYMVQKGTRVTYPFVRAQTYHGGKKHEVDATRHRVRELEVGFEWLPIPKVEWVLMYTFSDRTFEDSLRPDNRQGGRLLRIQCQLNF
ncbi:MAG: porin [Bacteroidetes bacterium]|nr:porin [Bacteroidota bacterium]